MAGLATAIGLGGKLPSKYSGDAEIIRQTGEGISGSIQSAGKGVNKAFDNIADQNKKKQKYLTPFSSNINALEKDKKQYEALASELTAELRAAADSGASAAQLMDMQVKATDKLADAKKRYEGDLEAYSQAYETMSKHPEKDVSEFNRFVTQGGYDETEVYEEGNVGAGPVAEKSGAPFEQEQTAGKMKAKRIGVPYFEMTLEQRKQAAPGGLMSELDKRTKDASGTFDKAAKSTFDQNDLGFMVDKRWEKINGVGQYVYTPDPEKVAKNLNTFLAQRGRTNDLEIKKYWNTITNKFEKEGKDAGLAGEELKSWVDAGVEAAARRDFMNALEAARQKRMSDDKYIVDKEGSGINITIGGGGSSVSDGKNVVKFVPQDVPNKAAVSPTAKAEIKKNQDKISQYQKALKKGENEGTLSDDNIERYKRAISSLENTNNKLLNKRNKNYFDFSSVINSEDPGISFIAPDGTEKLMSPQELYKDEETGQLMIGGKVKSKIEESVLDASGNPTGKTIVSTVEEDFSVPFNDQNKSRLFNNKPKLEPLFEKIDFSLLDGPKAKKKEAEKGGKYKIGQVVNGYKYVGGDPTNESSWKKI